MSHPLSPKEKAQDLWAKIKDLAEREGGLLDASVVDLLAAELDAWKKDITAKADEPTDIVDWDDVGWTYYGGPALEQKVSPGTPKIWNFLNTGFAGWTCDVQRLVDANPQWQFQIRKTPRKTMGGSEIWEIKAEWDACTREWWQQNYKSYDPNDPTDSPDNPKTDYGGELILKLMFEKGMFGPRQYGEF